MKSSEKKRPAKTGAIKGTELDNIGDNLAGGKLSPLAIPLEKEPRPPEESAAGEGQTQQSAVKRISQKEFLDKISARIDEKVEDALKKRPAFPGTITILLILFLSPLIINAGDSLYDYIKAQVTVPAAVTPVTDKKDDLRAVLKQNEALVKKLAGQNRILSKKLTALIRVQEKIAKKKPNKVVVLPSSGPAVFSMKREKKILYEISGIDIDDPITEKSINKIKSVQILLAMIESFNRILINSDHMSVSSFHLKNIVKAKRLVVKKLRQIK